MIFDKNKRRGKPHIRLHFKSLLILLGSGDRAEQKVFINFPRGV